MDLCLCGGRFLHCCFIPKTVKLVAVNDLTVLSCLESSFFPACTVCIQESPNRTTGPAGPKSVSPRATVSAVGSAATPQKKVELPCIQHCVAYNKPCPISLTYATVSEHLCFHGLELAVSLVDGRSPHLFHKLLLPLQFLRRYQIILLGNGDTVV